MRRNEGSKKSGHRLVRLSSAVCLFLPLCVAGTSGLAAAQSSSGASQQTTSHQPSISPERALAYEKSIRVFGEKFYQEADPFSSASAGTLIRSAATDAYNLPKGAHAVRILYHSQNATGKDVPASGVVLIPGGKAPPGGWPVIAWAHGTSGVAQGCAPSMMKNVYYGDEGLYPMVQAGFAVVATDYAGLGTVGPHQWIDKVSNAHDVINAVTAAHSAVPNLSKKWVVDGHSQGGEAAWGVAEQEAKIKDPNYLGAVMVAGAVNLRQLMTSLAHNTRDAYYMVYSAYAIKARFPEFNVADMLSEDALSHYAALTKKGCWFYGNAVAQSGELVNVVKPGWLNNKWVQEFFKENQTAKAPIDGPLFVIAGEADHSVPLQSIRDTVNKACAKGFTVKYRSYPGLDHDPVMAKSTPDQINWIKARFAGKPATGNCSKM